MSLIIRRFSKSLTLLSPNSTQRVLWSSNQFCSTNAAQKDDSQAKPETKDPLQTQIDELSSQLTEQKEKTADFLDKYKRALADGENMRTRLTKQIDDAKQFGIQSFCKDLLEVADVLGRATESVPKEELSANGNPHLISLFEGLKMTKATLEQTFKRYGIEPINPVNEKFNPNFHEALFQVENKSIEPNTVLEVSKIGYKLKDRCLRPALVGVSKQ